MTAGRPVRMLAASAAAAFLGLVLSTVGVAGHADLVATDPPDGTVLERAPGQLELTFSEAVAIDRSSFELVDASGATLPVGPAKWAGEDHARVVLTLPTLSTDAFRVAWRTVSESDLHVASGSLVFGVGVVPGQSAPDPDSSPRIGEAAVSGLGLIGFCGLVGVVVVLLAMLPGGRSGGATSRETSELITRLRRRLLTIGLVAATIGGMASLGDLAVRLVTADANTGISTLSLDAIGRSGFGIRALLTVVLYLLAVFALDRWRRHPTAASERVGRTAIGLGVLVVLLALARALNGHAAAGQPVAILAVVSATAHALAAGVWVGGLIVLAFAVAPLVRTGAVAAELAIWMLRGFAPYAAASVVALLLSGLVMAGRVVTSVDALLFSDYGRFLMVKVGVGAAVACVGLLNALALHPPSVGLARRAALAIGFRAMRRPMAIGGRSPIRRTVTLEASGALVVLGIAAVLSSTPPAIGAQWLPGPPVASTAKSAQVDDLLVTFTIRPNRPGRNFVSVAVHDTRRPAPAPIAAVQVRLEPSAAGAGPVPAEPLRSIGNDLYETVVDLPSDLRSFTPGVDVIRLGRPTETFRTSWSVLPAEPPSRHRPVVVSAEPIAPVLDGIVTLLMALIAGTALLAAVIRRSGAGVAGRPTIVAEAIGTPTARTR